MQNYHWPFMEKCHWTLMYTKYSLSSTTDCLLEVFGRLTYLCSLNLILDVYDKSMMFNRTHEMVFDRYEKNVIASLVSCWQTYILETKVVACPANLHVSLRWKPARRTHRHDLWVLPRRRDDIGGVVVDDCDCRCTNRFADEQCHRGDLAPSFSLARLHRRVRFRATAPPLPERAAGCCVIQSYGNNFDVCPLTSRLRGERQRVRRYGNASHLAYWKKFLKNNSCHQWTNKKRNKPAAWRLKTPVWILF